MNKDFLRAYGLFEYEQIDENMDMINTDYLHQNPLVVDSMYKLIEDNLEIKEESDLKL